MNEIKLPPLPAGYAPEIAAAMRNYARAAIKANLQTNQITGETSDGYHTFNELYAHRVRLFCLLMHAHKDSAWWSHKHQDGSGWDGWIIAGIDTPEGSATYHLPLSEIENLPEGIELPNGKEWDGHTSDDVLDRLLSLRQARGEPVYLVQPYLEKNRWQITTEERFLYLKEKYAGSKNWEAMTLYTAPQSQQQVSEPVAWTVKGVSRPRTWTWWVGIHDDAESTAKLNATALGDVSLAVPLYEGPQPQQISEGYKAVLVEPEACEPVKEAIERLAINRYRPVPAGVFSYKVVAGDGGRSLFSGTKDECKIVAAKLTEAFLDGAHVAQQPQQQARGGETVKVYDKFSVSSDDEIISVSQPHFGKVPESFGDGYLYASGRKGILNFARALLAKYGNQQISNEWKQAIDHELVSFGTTADSYSSPKEAIDALIKWNVSVATDPKVNGGYMLVPIEPTQKMLFACEDAGTISNHRRGKRIYKAMLAAAPHSGE